MPKVRRNPIKWARNTASGGPSYKEGTENPKQPWEESTLAGEGNYEIAVTAAIAEKRFGKGVSRSGQARYDQGVKEKGIARFVQAAGLASSRTRYNNNFERFAQAIEKVDLPPRGPKGQNLGRVQAIQDALIAEKAEG